MDTDTISSHSTYVESVLQHGFLSELLRHLWNKFPGEELQVYNAEVDSHGFDVVLTFRGRIRHVQLKSSSLHSTTQKYTINGKLATVAGGCVLLMIYNVETLAISGYHFFGFSSGEFPDISALPLAKATRGNALGVKSVRRNTRSLPKAHFHPRTSIETIATLMFAV